jgi:hypothetical protein
MRTSSLKLLSEVCFGKEYFENQTSQSDEEYLKRAMQIVSSIKNTAIVIKTVFWSMYIISIFV